MAPQPKRKHSKGRRDRRRAHDALASVVLIACPSCKEPTLPHHVCPSCGQYDGRLVVEHKVKEEKKK